jgi:8-oxo-dGTP pyrophosphatase MutT (NUDIX family)
MRSVEEGLRLVRAFAASPEEQKSRELTLALLEQTTAPFSRDQFHPGHITASALVLDPEGRRVLLMHHHRHKRWLLPGGHIETADATLADAARRETLEETAVQTAARGLPPLVGLDVHGIPARKDEPFHLHHDLIFALRAESDAFACTEEAPEVIWCAPNEFERFALPDNIIRAAARALRKHAALRLE